MPTARKNLFLPVSSFALVAAAGVAVLFDAAHAESQVPVRYGTDPGYAGEAPQALSYADEDAPAPVGEIEHIVQAGDTVYALGRLYDVPPASIIAKNRMAAPYELQIGQLVYIPQGQAEALPRTQTVGIDRRPIANVQTPRTKPREGRFALDSVYEVRQGDTVYSLSRRFGMSVTDFAAANNLRQPYTISVGQRLVVPGAAAPAPGRATQPIIAGSDIRRRTPDQRQLNAKVIEETMSPRRLPELGSNSPFAWPVRGPVLMDFGDKTASGTRSDGINIAAPIGAPVRATADGEVVYRGSELDGYGNLLLVKHDNGWVSAYAHTDAILVRKGDYVRQGQVIAKVGRSGSVDRPQLHFQLRKDLQPTDPIVAMQGELDGAGQALTAASLRR
ncbi:LysM peptidoglycan-binding domain-containing M23 family metallopeptidase [Parvularcula lutaonensis]|uniref:Peptidoglycan DD-metalloendopeptidase family protein n=1 Tax=Parvularcula lutaonensis TaxID=491923 RepID=A0ABV7MBC2_9PROT|nr:LysM peptidoglycan-binding domain-containing M23 family metallopeptidase [Parvularcula lutaonensis]GGY40045.1 hypothetical protein GCM10007148_05620 [Parvularcula lutaonensis]